MNPPVPAPGPGRHCGEASGPAESAPAPDATGAELGYGAGSSAPGESPDVIPDDEYEPL